jgi:60S ribosome subunit biogenesis protein NIP7
MRPLTDVETERLFEKLANYIGRNITHLIDRPADPHCFRVQKDRVYYVRESIARLATSVSRANLLSLGTCLGKFTKTGKFKLHVTALDHIAQHAKYKLWVKPNGEMPFLYGNNVLKAHVGRISDDTPEHQGVVVFAMNDTPLVRSFSWEFLVVLVLIGNFRDSVLRPGLRVRLGDLTPRALQRLDRATLESISEMYVPLSVLCGRKLTAG